MNTLPLLLITLRDGKKIFTGVQSVPPILSRVVGYNMFDITYKHGYIFSSWFNLLCGLVINYQVSQKSSHVS